MTELYDVVVIGGGPAGLGGALALARARRSVLVVDGGRPRNARAAHVHNYLGREGASPLDLLKDGRAEVSAYGGELVDDVVRTVARQDDGFRVSLDGGRTVCARRLLVTTGSSDALPEVPGLAARWGLDVLHCPYCHGWEVRDRRIGVIAAASASADYAQLWRQLSPHVLLLLHRAAPPDAETAERLAARGIAIVGGELTELVIEDDALAGVRLATGEQIALDAVAVASRFDVRSSVLESLGLEAEEVEYGGTVLGNQLAVDATGATAVPGVWAAGNVADFRATVISSAAAGLAAAAAINAELVADDVRDAVQAYRVRQNSMFDEAAWEERYHEKSSIWSGRPNPQLVAEVEGLKAGRALDVGSGEGADAVWLAARGWTVTGVDISRTALRRAQEHALAAGDGIAGRIVWSHVDLRQESPAAAEFDLVTSHFMQLPPGERRDLFARLAAAVAPGGTLLIVGHHPSDLHSSVHRMHFPDMLYTAQEIAESLDPSVWEVATAESRARDVSDHEGHDATIHDAVLVARRRT